ncbi:hypothetical protein Poli38472_002777 [Pythium oligandrum]|uniref:Uncharacterized protein n=1 Tax=Pythium oligandrum TaxID=41045 RepID=A0A8K1CJF7_PYTOL|nr:hypothetical protein Poli38472_002777 [Pythium oligandrum]|eukprot:TMW63836.1 hypothetical protein Poli38472_002777 [Pythium oligandrum]
MNMPTATPSKRKAPVEDETSDDEMMQHLREHSVLAYNEFVRQFQRQTNELIAKNRVLTEHHRRKYGRTRMRYPMAWDDPQMQTWQNQTRAQTSEPPTEPDSRVRKTCKVEIRSSSGSVQTLVRRTVILPRIPPSERASMWTALTKNYEVEDQPQLKYLPYFGDDDDEDVVSEFYQVKLQGTSACEVDFTRELCEAVLRQLGKTWELTKQDLRVVSKTIQVEPEVVAEVHKKLQMRHHKAKKAKHSATAEPDAANGSRDANGLAVDAETPITQQSHFQLYEKAADSYRSLLCRRCYLYDCDYHGCREVPKLEIAEQNAVHKMKKSPLDTRMGRNCGNQCFLAQTQPSPKLSKTRAISTAFGWDKAKQIACARAYFICDGNFCEIAKLLGDKTCLEVAEFCEQHEINTRNIASERKSRATPRNKKKKKMRPSISHLQHVESGPMNIIPTIITQCAHEGSCEDANCSCYEDGRLCSKLCYCVHEDCKIFFRGCRCVRGRCRTKACPCFASGRECDLDLCSVCCNDDVKLMAAAQDEMEEKPSAPPIIFKKAIGPCQNRNMGTSKRKQLRVGRSTMANAGLGLFVDDSVAKDEFIIEYIGEMVSQEEAERRGTIYDKLNRSYLFNLDTETVVDATRKGNKTRFINHSSKPNCYSRIVNINSDYRIGIYALRDIEPHTELFFDYGYEKDMQHEHLHKQPTITEWMKKR